MVYIRKHLLWIVSAAVLLLTTAGGSQTLASASLSINHFSDKQIKEHSFYGSTGFLMNVFQAPNSPLFYSSYPFVGSLSCVGHVVPVKSAALSSIVLMHGQKFYALMSAVGETGAQTTVAYTNESLTQRVISIYRESSLKVKILLVILAYLVLSLLVLFVTILVNRHIKSARRKRKKELQNEFQEQLASFLFDDDVERIEFRGINNAGNRQVFIDELMDLHSNLHGEAAQKLRDLYFNLGLHKDSLRKVYQRRWDKKAKGLGELAQMDVKDANEHISKYVDSSNPILRVQAQVAMVKLSENNPLGFLDNMKYELSYWEQVNIYDTLVYHQINIDSFEKWLDSENDSVRIFALRMIGLFKHVHSAPKTRELLFSENSAVALAAVQCLKHLEMAEYTDDLKVLYESETLKLQDALNKQQSKKKSGEIESLDDIIPRKIRYEVVEALQPTSSVNDIPFLEQVITDEKSSYKIRLLAIRIMLSIKPDGQEKVEEILADANELLTRMIINVKQNQES